MYLAFLRHPVRQLSGLCLVLLVSACASVPQPEQIEPSDKRIKLSAVGDIMLGASATEKMLEFGYDHAFAATRELFADSHIVFGNLEGPLTDGGDPEPDKRFIFRSPPDKVVPALVHAGFNLVSLANNHTLDYGAVGMQDTLKALDAAAIQYAGAGMHSEAARAPVIRQIGDTTVALLAYSLTFPENFWAKPGAPGTAFGHEEHIKADVTAARAAADIVMVSFHWGREATTELRPYQPYLAHIAIDAGASLILGHHPHVLQGMERYKDGLIFYSLGNFAFGSYSQRATRSVIAQVIFEQQRIVEARLIPINVNNVEVLFQPQTLIGTEADQVLVQMQKLSQPLGVQIENKDGTGIIDMRHRLNAELRR